MLSFSKLVGISLAWATGAVATEQHEAPETEALSEASRPTVVATSPKKGEVVAAGPLTLTVTFDRPMRRESYSFVKTGEGAFPDCPGRPELFEDGRTYRLHCTVQPGTQYELWFNRPPYLNFVSADSAIPAIPEELRFSTEAP